MTHTLHIGDCRTVLSTLDDASIDSIVCDPPYELGFMGKAWDNSGIAYDVTVWQQCYRVLKPGGHLVAFGGSRTYHRLAVAIEDAGFEIRDQIQWIYGSGFPKSLDVSKALDKQAGAVRDVVGFKDGANLLKSNGFADKAINGHKSDVPITAPATDLAKQWQGWGTALKPAHEPAVLARKPLCGTVADNVTAWGVGALNIDGTRVGDGGQLQWSSPRDMGYSGGTYATEYIAMQNPSGRWPANVIFDEEAAQILDEQSGERKTGGVVRNNKNEKSTVYSGGWKANTATGHSDSGGASRFFYVAKASKAEREAGLDGMERKVIYEYDKSGNMIASDWKADPRSPNGGYENKHTQPRANHHPTVKPLALMRYLVRLVTPKGGKVLDPFMGSGSTGCAAVLEGCDFVGIDITPEYVSIAQKRIDYYAVETPLEGMI